MHAGVATGGEVVGAAERQQHATDGGAAGQTAPSVAYRSKSRINSMYMMRETALVSKSAIIVRPGT